MSVRKVISSAVVAAALATGYAKENAPQQEAEKSNNPPDKKQQIVENNTKSQMPDWMPLTKSGALDEKAIDKTIQDLNLKENLPLIRNYMDAISRGEVGDAAYVEMVDAVAGKNEAFRKNLLMQQDAFKRMATTSSQDENSVVSLFAMSMLLGAVSFYCSKKAKSDASDNPVIAVVEHFAPFISSCVAIWAGINAVRVQRSVSSEEGIEKHIKDAYVQLYNNYSSPKVYTMTEQEARQVLENVRQQQK